MSITKITITTFLEQAVHFPVLDVRSPGEFNHAHIPGAYSLPLFTDEERKIVGTAYKQQGKQKAIKLGLDFFGVKMRDMVEQVEAIIKARQTSNSTNEHPNRVLVHCWRGGMRSGAVAWLLDLYGFEVYTLVGGYKAFRNWTLNQFENPYDGRIVGGFTGSGKTDILVQLQRLNEPVIDLEGLAHHKGSAFGGIGQLPQPSQEMFENKLAWFLSLYTDRCFWLEDESQRIGVLNIPPAFWKTMRLMPVYFVDIPYENRLQYIMDAYGSLEKEKLVNAIMRIQKRLGPLETKTAIGFLIEGDTRACFSILLQYYDKTYEKSLLKRENIDALLNKISCDSVDSVSNTQNILTCSSVHL
ncbi:MAG TPA: tRNA 2-selenouridine(34) synthase MnmH [Ferruginibacter sp.]|nr:tRNA 2-selenouridine(34) synthase MnmH [Ferruginibacter sp.]